MQKKNCWEFMECGREPGGKNVEKSGICPVSTSISHDSINSGKNAGRFCWTVAGTFCDGTPSGTYSEKLLSCLNCKFLKHVNNQENRDFTLNPD
ncbi:MAG: hypothetical protein PF485_03050 [Bacteroidales bacterium]|jgi:hypothetical protein|nr:hypothetical protein [Bacteroidales bacterium]